MASSVSASPKSGGASSTSSTSSASKAGKPSVDAIKAQVRENQAKAFEKRAERCLALDTGNVSQEASKPDTDIEASRPGLLDGLLSWGNDSKAEAAVPPDQQARDCLQGVLNGRMVELASQAGVRPTDIAAMLDSQNNRPAPSGPPGNVADWIKP